MAVTVPAHPPDFIPPKELRWHLNGLRARTSWTLLTLHATNVVVVQGQNVIANGPALFEYIKKPSYWEDHHFRPVPTMLWNWMRMAHSEGVAAASEVAGWAESTLYCGMVAEAYELALKCLDRNPTRSERFHAQPFVQFAKVIRNTVFHNGYVNECDGVKFPVVWGMLAFTKDMKKTALRLRGWFTTEKAFDIVEEFALYGDNNFGSPEVVAQEAVSR